MAFIRAAAHWRWPNGVIPYEFDDAIALSDPIRQTVFKAAVDFWHQRTPVRFVVRNNEADYIHVKRVPFKERCSMHVGRKGGMQVLECAGNPEVTRAAHELGHAIGLFPDRSPIAALTKNAVTWSRGSWTRTASCGARRAWQTWFWLFGRSFPQRAHLHAAGGAQPSIESHGSVGRGPRFPGAAPGRPARGPRHVVQRQLAAVLPGHLTGLGRTRRLVAEVGRDVQGCV
jgi:hypothetical protein